MQNKKKSSIPLSIWMIGIASGLLNITSSLIFSLSGLFLNSRGITIDWISTLEHTVESLAHLMKVFSGVISDFFRRRKTLILIGFGLSMLSRPLLALGVTFLAATTAFIVMFISRVMERIANGLQSTPRDALVADLSPKDIKGECFGLRQTLTTAGSFIGALLAMLFMNLTSGNYERIFWYATIPPVIAFLILCFYVKEEKRTKEVIQDAVDRAKVTGHEHNGAPQHAQSSDVKTFGHLGRMIWKKMVELGKPFWCIMLVVMIFMLARVSEAILSLHALQTHGLPATWVPIIGVIYNTVTSFSSYPIGRLSDQMPRAYVLMLGCGLLVGADVLLGYAPNLYVVFIGVALWGAQIGITQSMFLALIADHVPQNLRGTGFGLFYLFCAFSTFVAGWYGGYLSYHYSISTMYLFSGVVACLAIFVLFLVHRKLAIKK